MHDRGDTMENDGEKDWFERALAEKKDGSFSDQEADSSGGSGDSLFEESFSSALESASKVPVSSSESDGSDVVEFDFQPGSQDFDDTLDSTIPRVQLGIDGLDRMIQGGIPEQSLIAVIGEAGTGKTTFGLQFLNHALELGENVVFITLEEDQQQIITSAMEKGYDFERYHDDGRLAILDLDPIEMATSLTSIQNELPKLIEDYGASRIVLDSVSLLEMMYDDRSKRRNEIFDFTQSLKQAGVTSLLTSEASDVQGHVSRYGIVEYLTDAVFVLQYIRSDDFQETRLGVEIQKIRNANHSRDMKPYEITADGISVYQQANLF